MLEVIGLVFLLLLGGWLTFAGAIIHMAGSLLRSKSESIGGAFIFISGIAIIVTTIYFNFRLK